MNPGRGLSRGVPKQAAAGVNVRAGVLLPAPALTAEHPRSELVRLHLREPDLRERRAAGLLLERGGREARGAAAEEAPLECNPLRLYLDPRSLLRLSLLLLPQASLTISGSSSAAFFSIFSSCATFLFLDEGDLDEPLDEEDDDEEDDDDDECLCFRRFFLEDFLRFLCLSLFFAFFFFFLSLPSAVEATWVACTMTS
eukprot:CAMPEP_0179241706 /NCGR_PEP_ID=MMETSP0797-20121207/16632_1 /TAXON_ID=47934 /ORGANISM="Dinophysis acuminata, Strain DAEP01" /LENGTH=197 /DNA_ID=CAMNT_0020949103 /DNA_START=146 /DNA_END=741 /DNA_ORIENTATION=+